MSKYITIAEAAAILNKTPQAIYQNKTLSEYIKTIDGKKVILRAAIEEDKPSESNLISHYEKLLTIYEKQIEQLREDNERKDKLINELASNAAELNKRFSVLLQNEQLKSLESSLNEPLKNVECENAAKPRRKRFFGLF